MEKVKKNKWIIISIIGVLVIGIIGFILINNLTKKIKFKEQNITLNINEKIDLFDYLKYVPSIKEKINFTLSDNTIGEIKDFELYFKKTGNLIITAKYENIESKMNIIIKNDLAKKCEYEFNEMPKSLIDGKMDLNCENITFKIGNNITGKLIGTKTNDIENEETYKYKLELNINDRKMGTSLFETNGFIWSYNYAATFNVFKFNELYVFKSNIANVCGEDYAVIYDKNGNFIKQFNNAELSFNSNNIYEFKCEDIEKETIRKIKYQVESGTLKEIETTNEKWYE